MADLTPEEEKLERYQKTIPPLFQLGANPFITALIEALATSDADIEINIKEGNNQLFVPRAEKAFLDALGSNVGVKRPASVNLDDDKFRELIPTLSYKPKQVRKTMYDVMDVFYGPLYSRSNITAVVKGPYNLGNLTGISGQVTFQRENSLVYGAGTSFLSQINNGDYIRLISHGNTFFAKVASVLSDTQIRLSSVYKGGNGTQKYIGNAVKFVAPTLTLDVDFLGEKNIQLPPNLITLTTAATAEEISATINSQFNLSGADGNITASVIDDPIANSSFVNLRTNSPGSTGNIRIAGGSVNRFSYINQNNILDQVFINTDEASQFSIGMQVFCGSLEVDQIETIITNIELDTPSLGVTRITVAQDVGVFTEDSEGYILCKGDLGFPTKLNTIDLLPLKTVIYETNPKELIFRIPATVPALRRSLKGSTHPRAGWNGRVVSVDNINKIITADMDEAIIANSFTGAYISSNYGRVKIVSNTAGKNGVIFTFDINEDLSIVPSPQLLAGSVTTDPSNLHKIIGTGTAFSSNLVLSDVIRIGNQDLTVGKVNSNTELLTTSPLELGIKQIQDIDLRGDTVSDLNNKYWILYSANDMNIYHVWYNVSGLGTEPISIIPGSIGVEVAVSLGNTNQQVALATMTQLNLLGDFTVTNPYIGKLIVENVIAGVTTKAHDVNVGGTWNNNILAHGTGNSSDILSGTDIYKIPRDNQLSFVILNDNYISSYVYDPENASFTATQTRCTLNQIVDKGTIQPQITVVGADSFPNAVGFVVFDFGKEREEVPVRYRGRPNNNTLLIDPSYIFKRQHRVGEVINLLAQPLLGTKPRKNGSDYPAYVTGLVEARIAVETILKSIKAAGVAARFIIDVPDYLWDTSWDPLAGI